MAWNPARPDLVRYQVSGVRCKDPALPPYSLSLVRPRPRNRMRAWGLWCDPLSRTRFEPSECRAGSHCSLVWEGGHVLLSPVAIETCAGRLCIVTDYGHSYNFLPMRLSSCLQLAHSSLIRGVSKNVQIRRPHWRGVAPLVRSPVPGEVCAGRLAEAEAETFKGAERACAAGGCRQALFRTCRPGGRWPAGAPEPKQTEPGQGLRTRI